MSQSEGSQRVPEGFGKRSTAMEVVSGHDLGNCHIIVTGGASGIGLETVRSLATAGAAVVVAVRDCQRSEPAIEHVRQTTGCDTIEIAHLDLASLASVRRFVELYLEARRPLDLLINNAGVMATPLTYTEDGFELQLGTNYLGHFALTMGLMPALRQAGHARIVILTSLGHRSSDVHLEDLNYRHRPYDPMEAYGQSKTANALCAVGLTRQVAWDGLTANAVMPGGVYPTGLQKHQPLEEHIARGYVDEAGNINPRFKTVEQGAATTIWAAVAPELEGRSGLYLEDCSVAQPWTGDGPTTLGHYMPYALDPDRADRLWSIAAALIAG